MGDSANPYVERITMADGVAVYGGFAGGETLRGQRNWQTNETILDGSVQGDPGTVVTAPTGVTYTARIDGFTIRNGEGSDNHFEQHDY